MKKSYVSLLSLAALGMTLIFSATGCRNSSASVETVETSTVVETAVVETTTEAETTAKQTEEYSELSWARGTLGNMVPEAKSNVGKLGWETEKDLCLYITNLTKDDFIEYVNTCKEAGFDKKYDTYENSFTGYNEDGYKIYVTWDTKRERMTIMLDAPRETETIAESAETTEVTETSEAVSTDDIDPEFKAALDAYEAFFDEYCEFIKEYKTSSDPAKLISQYSSYMEKYSEAMKGLSDMNKDLTAAESLYYAEVMTRIATKLQETVK